MENAELKRYLQSIVEPDKAAEPIELSVAIRRIDDFVRGGHSVPPRLRHYLERRSYAKALTWLNHPETPHQP